MKKITLLLSALFITGTVAMAQQNNMKVTPRYDDLYTPSAADVTTPQPAQEEAHWLVPTKDVQLLLHDNGSFVNGPGQGAGGKDASICENVTLMMSLWGTGHALASGYRVADDFTVPAGELWTISEIQTFAYQTGSSTTSTINAVNFRIWSGLPGAGVVVWGDGTTNLMTSSVFSNCYRMMEDDMMNTQRPVMKQTSTLTTPAVLGAGTYWLDWQCGGTLSSGPWANPIAILNQMTTGNARQYIPSTTSWQAVRDTGSTSSLGLPFILNGTTTTGIVETGNTAEISVYPNPAKDIVRVKTNGVIEKIVMTNALGQVVYETLPGVARTEINTASFERGVYMINVDTDNGPKNYKLVLN
jgi:hypothetical protein